DGVIRHRLVYDEFGHCILCVAHDQPAITPEHHRGKADQLSIEIVPPGRFHQCTETTKECLAPNPKSLHCLSVLVLQLDPVPGRPLVASLAGIFARWQKTLRGAA